MVNALIVLINLLPRRVVLILASMVGRGLYRVSRLTRFRNALENNIRTAFPERFSDREASKIAKKHAADLVKTAVEVARFRELPRLLRNRTIEVTGLSNLRTALEKGNGAVVVSAHMGNWELLIPLLGLLGYPVHAIVLKQANSGFNRWLVRERERFGSRVLYAGETKSRTVEEILARNGIVLLFADHHNYGGKARNIVEFFGKPVSVPAGPVIFPLRTGASLVPAYVIRLAGERHLLTIEAALDLSKTGEPETDVLRNCREYIRVFERWISDHPEQWMWSHERWAWLDENLQPKY